MGLRENIRASASEQRTISGVPWRPWDSPFMRFDVGGPAHPTRSFYGPDEALGLPALYAGIKLLSEGVASLPLRVYQGVSGMSSRNNPGRHSLWNGPTIFDKPSVIGTAFDWQATLMASVGLQGNAWGFITGKDGYGFPTGIEWVPAQDVYVHEPRDQQTWNPLSARVFVFGREVRWFGPDSEMFHIKGLPMPGMVEGISPLRAFALTILAGKEAARYGESWYETGGFPPGTFQNSEIEIDAEQAAEIRHDLVQRLRRREPLVYGRDWDYKPVVVPPSEAQFIQAMQLNATQVAAILNLPANRLGGTTGDSLHYSTQADDTLAIIEALRPWLVRYEQAFFDLLPRNRFTKYWTDALLKTNLLERFQIYQIQRNIGFRNSDELRELEDLEPQPNGIGAEDLPLTLMNAMGTRAGAIPKSLLKAIVLEMDVATDRLIKLEKTYIQQGKLPQAAVPVAGAGGGPGNFGGGPGGGSTAGANGQRAGMAPDPNNGYPMQPPLTETGFSYPPGMEPIGRPNAPLPLAQDPASFLASLISVQRDANQPYEAREAAREILDSICTRYDQIVRDHPDEPVPATDLLAPFVPARPDIEDRIHSTRTPQQGHL